MDISTKTLDEMKTLAYDQIVLLNQTQTNLNILQQEIAKRSTQEETHA